MHTQEGKFRTGTNDLMAAVMEKAQDEVSLHCVTLRAKRTRRLRKRLRK